MKTYTRKTPLNLDDKLAQQVELCGGKGANLARLAAAGFRVPDARIVCVNTYEAWFDQLNPSLIDGFAKGVANNCSTGNASALTSQCSELRKQLDGVALPASVEAELRLELETLSQQGLVSVRSSATLEDMHGAAFAGQHDTFLGVQGIDQVIARIVDCYISLWEYRAVRYRFEKGFDVRDIKMAVVVQKMIDAQSAGVAFSAHPVSGRLDQVLINSAFGLGETVVSGDGEIDQYSVNADGEIIQRHIGQKTHALFLGEQATVSMPLVAEKQRQASLKDHHILALATLAVAAEKFFGFPQDIEWALDDHGLHLLQSRPISELPARWTRQESAERFPGPVTPLTWDFTTAGFHESLSYSLDVMGLPPFNGRWFERIDGNVFGNQTAVDLYTAGQQTDFRSLDELAERVDDFRENYAWVQTLPSLWSVNLDRFLLRLGTFNARTLSECSSKELWQHIIALEKAGNEYFLPNIAISITQGLLHRTLYKLVAMVCDELAPVVYDDLTCFCETKTARVNAELFDLQQLIIRNSRLQALLQTQNRRTLYEDGKLGEFPVFQEAFAQFLTDHGHREVEFDAYYPTWNKQPWVVLENLRLMSMQQGIVNPAVRDAQSRSRQHHSELDFLAKLPKCLRGFAKELIQLSRTYTALDDLEHYHTTRLSVPFREAIIELGARFVQSGFIDNEDDLFFLTRDALGKLVAGNADLAATAALLKSNKKQFMEQQSSEPPFEPGCENVSVMGDSTDAITGLPGAPGVAEGRTCIIRSSDDFASFIPGSILVARTTNPAWTPLFYAASAVVTESGGPLSHGAVTAREIGIPAVVAARGAIGALGDDQLVRVNGRDGKVVLLDCVKANAVALHENHGQAASLHSR